MERQIEGQQSCQDRLYRKEESKMEIKIENLLKQLETENLVSNTIKKHLAAKQSELQKLTKEREN